MHGKEAKSSDSDVVIAHWIFVHLQIAEALLSPYQPKSP
jgi:hypothetical protein